MTFENCSQRIDPKDNAYSSKLDLRGYYFYDAPSPYMYVWSKLFQSLISIAATKMLTDKWHTSQCGIYKSEGGCNLPGENALVLLSDMCYFDYGNGERGKGKLDKCAKLIGEVVLNWVPEDPIQSMFAAAAEFIGETQEDLENAVKAIYEDRNPFGGDALSSFFDYNPFSKFPVDRDYLRFCLVQLQGGTDEDVDQQFADEDLGDTLLARMQKKLREGRSPGQYVSTPMCCSPTRNEDGLRFWINDGTSTPINGWKTEEEIELFIADPEKFKETA